MGLVAHTISATTNSPVRCAGWPSAAKLLCISSCSTASRPAGVVGTEQYSTAAYLPALCATSCPGLGRDSGHSHLFLNDARENQLHIVYEFELCVYNLDPCSDVFDVKFLVVWSKKCAIRRQRLPPISNRTISTTLSVPVPFQPSDNASTASKLAGAW